jgi:hypothetical protein
MGVFLDQRVSWMRSRTQHLSLAHRFDHYWVFRGSILTFSGNHPGVDVPLNPLEVWTSPSSNAEHSEEYALDLVSHLLDPLIEPDQDRFSQLKIMLDPQGLSNWHPVAYGVCSGMVIDCLIRVYFEKEPLFQVLRSYEEGSGQRAYFLQVLQQMLQPILYSENSEPQDSLKKIVIIPRYMLSQYGIYVQELPLSSRNAFLCGSFDQLGEGAYIFYLISRTKQEGHVTILFKAPDQTCWFDPSVGVLMSQKALHQFMCQLYPRDQWDHCILGYIPEVG